jgi:hypothetical protein
MTGTLIRAEMASRSEPITTVARFVTSLAASPFGCSVPKMVFGVVKVTAIGIPFIREVVRVELLKLYPP